MDLADPFRAGEHAEAEEEQQRRDPHSVGEQRAGDPGGEENPRDEDQDGVVVAHPETLGEASDQTFSSIIARRASSSSGEPGCGVSPLCAWGRR